MAINPNLTDLDLNQALKRCIDALNDALRVQIGDTAFEISTDASEDSMANRQMYQSENDTVDQAASTGPLSMELDVEGFSSFQMMVIVTSALTGSATAEIQVSPDASGDTWINTGTTLAVTGSANAKSTIDTSLARRVRVNLSANSISVGAATLYLIARG